MYCKWHLSDCIKLWKYLYVRHGTSFVKITAARYFTSILTFWTDFQTASKKLYTTFAVPSANFQSILSYGRTNYSTWNFFQNYSCKLFYRMYTFLIDAPYSSWYRYIWMCIVLSVMVNYYLSCLIGEMDWQRDRQTDRCSSWCICPFVCPFVSLSDMLSNN